MAEQPAIQFIPFISFAVAAALISAMIIRAVNFFYGKIGTYHPTYLHETTEDEAIEKIFYKVGKLAFYNFITSISTVGLIALYSVSPIGSGLGLNSVTGIALVTVALILNFSIRVGSLADVSTEFVPDVLDRSQAFGFGFMLSVYFLMLFGAATYVIHNGYNIPFEGNVQGPGTASSFLVLVVIFGPIIAACLSEALLMPRALGVNNEFFDQFDNK